MEKPVEHKYPAVKTVTDHERISMVKEIFSTITGKYDFLNHLLSCAVAMLHGDASPLKRCVFSEPDRFLDVASAQAIYQSARL